MNEQPHKVQKKQRSYDMERRILACGGCVVTLAVKLTCCALMDLEDQGKSSKHYDEHVCVQCYRVRVKCIYTHMNTHMYT